MGSQMALAECSLRSRRGVAFWRLNIIPQLQVIATFPLATAAYSLDFDSSTGSSLPLNSFS